MVFVMANLAHGNNRSLKTAQPCCKARCQPAIWPRNKFHVLAKRIALALLAALAQLRKPVIQLTDCRQVRYQEGIKAKTFLALNWIAYD